MTNIRIRLAMTLLIAPATPGLVQAQGVAVAASCAEGWSTLGALGITEFSCDCTFERGATTAWRFRGEPEIRAVSSSGPAAGRLRNGDIIVALDGMLITTRAAGARLAALEPGVPVLLTVRRGNRELDVRIVPDEPCKPPPVPVSPAAPVSASSPRVTPRPPRTATPVPAAQPVQPVPPAPPLPTAWFGFGINCRNCELTVTNRRAIEAATTELRELLGRADDNSPEVRAARARIATLRREGTSWKFSEYPSLFSVDPGSPAYDAGLRRGDVLLRIDGASLISEEGARRFSQVEPGQTVNLTYRRGGSERTVRVRAIERPTGSLTLSSGERVAEALAALERTQAQRAVELAAQAARLEETVERTTGNRSSEVNQRKLAELAELASELDRLSTAQTAESGAQLARLRKELELVARARTTPVPVAEEQHLRFAGSVGNTEVEVRGRSSVVVSYDNSTGELLIRTVDSTIRVKAPTPRR